MVKIRQQTIKVSKKESITLLLRHIETVWKVDIPMRLRRHGVSRSVVAAGLVGEEEAALFLRCRNKATTVAPQLNRLRIQRGRLEEHPD